MNVARPYEAIALTVEGDVLVVLAGTTRPLTGREVARLVRRGSQTSVARALDRLVRHGLVLRTPAGNAFMHILNREHVAAPAVESLATLRIETFRRIREEVAGWEIAPIHASIFGSAARADGDEESDIDLLVVRPSSVDEEDEIWTAQLSELDDRVFAWTGNRASASEVAETDLPALGTAEGSAIASIRDDAIDLAGVPARELLKGHHVEA